MGKQYINDPKSIIIEVETVERVNEYKYLGIVIDDELKGNVNTNVVMKKCKQRPHFIRISNNLKVDKQIISLFYKSTLEYIITYYMV